jgi:hypothetical protein
MVMETIGLILVLSHMMVIGALILWFGLGKPLTAEKFWMRFKAQFLSMNNHTKCRKSIHNRSEYTSGWTVKQQAFPDLKIA